MKELAEVGSSGGWRRGVWEGEGGGCRGGEAARRGRTEARAGRAHIVIPANIQIRFEHERI